LRGRLKMLKFKKELTGRQSPWIIDEYLKYFSNKTDGFLVEIGVGGVVDWVAMGLESPINGSDRILDWDKDWDSGKIIRGSNHTIELIEQGWSGIYIESLHEYLDNELEPLFDKILPDEYKDNVKLVRCGASDKRKICKILHHETLIVEEGGEIDKIIPYEYHLHGGRRVQCENTSVLLEQNGCPKDLDLMVIDVEGHEISVLNGLDFEKYQPKLIFIETGIIDANLIEELISNRSSQSYIKTTTDGLNTLFVRNDFYKKINS
jgi:hypothetical protein